MNINRLSSAVPVKSHNFAVRRGTSRLGEACRLNLIDFILFREIDPAPGRSKQKDRESDHESKGDPGQGTCIAQIRLLEHDIINIALHGRKAEIQDIAAIQKDSAAKSTCQIDHQRKKDGGRYHRQCNKEETCK